ncbi:sensor domain-containing diguanylate cyclase [Reinekea forsetii]|nr:sensor domain-containing diguanylate cyclase [Reinekea forsetii]
MNPSLGIGVESALQFYKLILDSTSEHIVVIDEQGDIQFVNKQWSNFGLHNECTVGQSWKGVNYISECDKAAAMGDEFGAQAAKGIRGLINQTLPSFYFEYPCHSPLEKRWFMMHVTQFELDGDRFFIISHQNITERKQVEEAIANLAMADGLTNIANRRMFDQFLNLEWRRCKRLEKPICLAIIDLDFFKELNDEYGHQKGDECLKLVANLLNGLAHRPGDLAARYGGEEFALVLGDTQLENACTFAQSFLDQIAELDIENINAPTGTKLSASIGIAELMPIDYESEQDLIKRADKLLYKAKTNGRNRIELGRG